MSRRPWPSLWLYENPLQLPTKQATAHTALYNLRIAEYDINAEHERIVRIMLRRDEKTRLGLHPPAVLEVSEHDRTHPSVSSDDGLLCALMLPYDLTRASN